MLLSISYELGEVADTAEPPFDLDEKLEYRFHYNSALKMKKVIFAVGFTFSAEKPVLSLVTELLSRIARKGLQKLNTV